MSDVFKLYFCPYRHRFVLRQMKKHGSKDKMSQSHSCDQVTLIHPMSIKGKFFLNNQQTFVNVAMNIATFCAKRANIYNDYDENMPDYRCVEASDVCGTVS